MTELINGIQSADMAVLDFIQAHRCAFLDAVMPYITHLGAGGILWIILAVALLCVKKYRRSGLAVSAALIFCLIFCNLLLKNIVARPRPFDINTAVTLLISRPADYSFPSGHTAASFAAAAALLLCGNRAIGAASLAAAFCIAFSRLYLYVHFPSDVLAGAVLGLLSAAAAYKITGAVYDKS